MRTTRPTKVAISALIVSFALLIFSALPVFAQVPTLRANGKIAFAVSSVDGQQSGISVMNPDGSGRTQLTATQILCPPPNGASGTCGPDQLDYSPSWSPDGKQIAFIRIVTAEQLRNLSDVFVMNADGSNQRRLTQNGSVVNYSSVTWSPDGTKLAFVGPPVAGDPSIQIYVMNADGSNKHPVGPGQNPAWSPDGSKLAFPFNSFDSDNGIHVMNPDGSGRTKITTPNDPIPGTPWDADSGPVWAPDSTRILFVRYVGCEEFGDNHCQSITVWTVNTDGSNPAKLADIPADGLAWSPDEKKIVFRWIGVDGDDRDLDIFTMEPDGSNITRLTNTPDEYERMPSWQTVAPTTCSSPNTIDCADFFVRQQYLDFLGREPEPEGLQFYLDILDGCHPNDSECIRYTRGALAANFFRSPEFQAKGSYVMYAYMVTIGQRAVTVAELQDQKKIERPHYAEFMADMSAISSPDDRNGPDPAKKAALTQDFVQRPEIVAKYPTSSYPTVVSFGNALAATAGVTLSSSTQNAIAAATTRAQVLQIVAESSEVNAKFYKPAFVTMEYFGYLRRDPEDCHDSANWWGKPDASDCGYIYHNRRFNDLPLDPDMVQNFIVRGFIESPEYRGRFGLP